MKLAVEAPPAADDAHVPHRSALVVLCLAGSPVRDAAPLGRLVRLEAVWLDVPAP